MSNYFLRFISLAYVACPSAGTQESFWLTCNPQSNWCIALKNAIYACKIVLFSLCVCAADLNFHKICHVSPVNLVLKCMASVHWLTACMHPAANFGMGGQWLVFYTRALLAPFKLGGILTWAGGCFVPRFGKSRLHKTSSRHQAPSGMQQ